MHFSEADTTGKNPSPSPALKNEENLLKWSSSGLEAKASAVGIASQRKFFTHNFFPEKTQCKLCVGRKKPVSNGNVSGILKNSPPLAIVDSDTLDDYSIVQLQII